jgi:hypothetical protein
MKRRAVIALVLILGCTTVAAKGQLNVAGKWVGTWTGGCSRNVFSGPAEFCLAQTGDGFSGEIIGGRPIEPNHYQATVTGKITAGAAQFEWTTPNNATAALDAKPSADGRELSGYANSGGVTTQFQLRRAE